MQRTPDFWNLFDVRRVPSIEILNIPPRIIVDYVKSMVPVYYVIARDNPQIVFAPDRGAAPLVWTLETISEINPVDININFATLPIGTHTDTSTGRESGYNYSTKKKIVEQELNRLRAAGLLDSALTHVVLLDEAQSGSTSATATRILKDLLSSENPNIKITYIPCRDEGRNVAIRNADAGYKSLAGGEVKGIEGFTIPVPIFFIDRPVFLDIIAIPTEEGVPVINSERMLMKIHNSEARKVFRYITLLVMLPEVTRAIVTEGMGENDLPEVMRSYYLEIHAWVNLLENTNTGIARVRIMQWIRSIYNKLNCQTDEIF